jgi:periplasmic divalent cation tolerance protein
VSEGLAACVNILPDVISVFQWQGALHEDDEHTLLIKVPADRVDTLRARIKALHAYTVPEILVLPVDVEQSNPDYVAWVRSTRPFGEKP